MTVVVGPPAGGNAGRAETEPPVGSAGGADGPEGLPGTTGADGAEGAGSVGSGPAGGLSTGTPGALGPGLGGAPQAGDAGAGCLSQRMQSALTVEKSGRVAARTTATENFILRVK